ncbi:MAG: hypothetical protein QOF57_1080 [Frankiaceae bacterium]|jgi:GAF domain-containing protein|nr:hypothetical protein [Frankiaceae bacterium]
MDHPPGATTNAQFSGADLAAIVLSDMTLDAVLTRVADAARRALPMAAETSVTLLHDGGPPTTVASTDPLAVLLDEAQYAHGAGPCLDAAKDGITYLIEDMTTEVRWPQWTPSALAHGAHSSLSLPLAVEGRLFGALNIYSTSNCAFDADARAIGEAFASYASVAVANAELYAATATMATNMEQAMRSRAVIEQAKGMLMVLHGINADDAFARLADQSQRANRKLRDVATTIVEEGCRLRAAPTGGSTATPERSTAGHNRS